MKRRRSRSFLLGSFLLAIAIPIVGAACTSDPDNRCVTGVVVGCTCADGRSGQQTCGGDRVLSACTCRDAPPDGGIPDVKVAEVARPEVDFDALPPRTCRAEPRGAGGMVPVAAGKVTMGCDLTPDNGCYDKEKPKHTVTVSAFQIDRTEVSQSEFKACVDAGKCKKPSCDYDPVACKDYPVSCVSWDDAAAYCAFAGKRLPTEAEWERAARGDDARIYPWGLATLLDCTRANFIGFEGCDINGSDVVGVRPEGASPFGALDMAGNVWEWVADHYDPGYYATSPATDPKGPASGSARVVRGGSFISGTAAMQTFHRDGYAPDTARNDVGFRCAKAP